MRSVSEPLSRLLGHLQGVRPTRDGYEARCPAHEDRRASLSLRAGPDGRALVFCHAGCSIELVVQSIGFDLADLFDAKGSKGFEPERQYDYTDEAGTLLYQVVRFFPKDFRQRKPEPDGGWSWSLNGTRRVLYHLPEVIQAAQAGRVIFITEGEKDADALRRHGLVATTNPGGAGKWRQEYGEALRGAHLVLLPDNDEPGESHALQVAAAEQLTARSIRLVHLPGLPAKGDVSDWLANGGSATLLKDLVRATPRWGPERRKPAAGPLGPKAAFLAAAAKATTRAQLIQSGAGLSFPWARVHGLVGQLVPGQLVVLGGRAKQGKSTFIRELFAAWTEEFGKKVMLVGTEQSAEEVRGLWACQALNLPPDALNEPQHQAAILDDIMVRQQRLADRALIYVPERMDLDALKELTHLAAEEKCDAVLFDHFTRLDLKGTRSKWEESGDAIRAVKRLARSEKMLVITAAQLTDGDGAFGQYDVPTGASWAYTRELQRECDVGCVVWRPLIRAPTPSEVLTAKADPKVVAELIQPNTMAFRVVAHRLRGDAAFEVGCRLRVENGRLTSWSAA